MAAKTDFTAQEWEVLCHAPHLVMLSVATAGSSGPIGSIKEAFAPAGAIIEAAKGNNELLRQVFRPRGTQGGAAVDPQFDQDRKRHQSAARRAPERGGRQSRQSQRHFEAEGRDGRPGCIPPTPRKYCRPYRKGGEGRQFPGIWRRMDQRRRTNGYQPNFASTRGAGVRNGLADPPMEQAPRSSRVVAPRLVLTGAEPRMPWAPSCERTADAQYS